MVRQSSSGLLNWTLIIFAAVGGRMYLLVMMVSDGAHDKIIHAWLDKQVGIERLGDAKNSETFEV